MPVLIRLQFIPQQDIFVHAEQCPGQGWFLALAAAWDPTWAECLHQGVELRQYSLSPLYRSGHGDVRQDAIPPNGLLTGAVSAGQLLSLRLGLTDDERAWQFLAALPALPVPPLNGVACKLTTVGAPSIHHQSWAALADVRPAARLHFSFETPTAFSHKSESLLLPEPERLLAGWRRSWRAAPEMPQGENAVTAESLRVTSYRLQTQSMRIKGGLRIGFVGTLELTWQPNTPAAIKRAGTALALLTEFLGTGAKTALGMGQTRVHHMPVAPRP